PRSLRGRGPCSNGSVLGPGFERARDRDATLDLRARVRQNELDRRQRGGDVEDVEPADVADAEDLSLQAALSVRDRNAEAVTQFLDDLRRVDAVRCPNRRLDGRPLSRRDK